MHCFMWFHGGHLGVPKERDGCHFGEPEYPQGNWTQFVMLIFSVVLSNSRIRSINARLKWMQLKKLWFLTFEVALNSRHSSIKLYYMSVVIEFISVLLSSLLNDRQTQRSEAATHEHLCHRIILCKGLYASGHNVKLESDLLFVFCTTWYH